MKTPTTGKGLKGYKYPKHKSIPGTISTQTANGTIYKPDYGYAIKKGISTAPQNAARAVKRGVEKVFDYATSGKINNPNYSKWNNNIKTGNSLMNKKKAVKHKTKRKNWIAGAIKKPGALRSELGAKPGKKIPAGKLAKAAKKGGKLGKRAQLAETLKKLHHKKHAKKMCKKHSKVMCKKCM